MFLIPSSRGSLPSPLDPRTLLPLILFWRAVRSPLIIFTHRRPTFPYSTDSCKEKKNPPSCHRYFTLLFFPVFSQRIPCYYYFFILLLLLLFLFWGIGPVSFQSKLGNNVNFYLFLVFAKLSTRLRTNFIHSIFGCFFFWIGEWLMAGVFYFLVRLSLVICFLWRQKTFLFFSCTL